MANIIQIKSSSSTTDPTGLANGELAWLDDGTGGAAGKLFIGDATSGGAVVRHIGGAGAGLPAASSLAADDISAGDGAVSIATSSGGITIDSNSSVVAIDGHGGVSLTSSSSGDIVVTAAADLVLDAAGGNIEIKNTTVKQLTIDTDSTAGDIDVNLEVDGDDLVFNAHGGAEILRLNDDASSTIGGAIINFFNSLFSIHSKILFFLNTNKF